MTYEEINQLIDETIAEIESHEKMLQELQPVLGKLNKETITKEQREQADKLMAQAVEEAKAEGRKRVAAFEARFNIKSKNAVKATTSRRNIGNLV